MALENMYMNCDEHKCNIIREFSQQDNNLYQHTCTCTSLNATILYRASMSFHEAKNYHFGCHFVGFHRKWWNCEQGRI